MNSSASDQMIISIDVHVTSINSDSPACPAKLSTNESQSPPLQSLLGRTLTMMSVTAGSVFHGESFDFRSTDETLRSAIRDGGSEQLMPRKASQVQRGNSYSSWEKTVTLNTVCLRNQVNSTSEHITMSGRAKTRYNIEREIS